jgi:hypothetical protein
VGQLRIDIYTLLLAYPDITQDSGDIPLNRSFLPAKLETDVLPTSVWQGGRQISTDCRKRVGGLGCHLF